jgi:hypothetical protein
MTEHMPTGGVLGSGDAPADDMSFDEEGNPTQGAPRPAGSGNNNEPLF